MKNNNRGVSLGVVIVSLLTISMVVGSVLTLTLRFNNTQQDQYIWVDAKNAAEAAAEYGFADLVGRFMSNNSFPINTLAPGNNPLRLPTQYFTTFGQKTGSWGLSRIVLPNTATYNPNAASQWNTWSTEVIGGQLPTGVWKMIDPNAPGNEFDPLKGKLVFTRNIKVYGKATSQDSRGKTNSAYCVEELQVRDAPLFAHAIFYNMDMEIAPGAYMKINGPVHTNYNAYVSSSAGLDFTGPFTTAAGLYWGTMSGFGKSPTTGGVTFVNNTGTQTSMYQSGSWLDTNNSNFRQTASQLWGGNVMTAAMNIPKFNPVAIGDYVRDDPTTSSTLDDALNYAYQLIQPAIANNSSSYNAAIEQQKYAAKAGLTIEITTGSTPTYTLYSYQRDADGNVVYDSSTHNPIKVALALNTMVAGNDFLSIEKYATASGTVTAGLYDARRAKGVNLVKVNMGKLTTVLNKNLASDWGGTSTQAPSNWWNGIVYVSFPTSGTAGSDGVVTATNAAGNYWGVQLYNGATIPNPTYAQSSGIYGTSIASNEPAYIWGNYNADGNSSTGTNGSPDSANEPVAAVAADAVTLLSTAWTNANSLNYSLRNSSSFTEVSAAILTGISPSDKANNNQYSGGVENFPRFLEDWSGDTIRYRGSMVCLFESELANEPWGSSNVYAAPNRDWSFNQQFAAGKYPPGTPNTRTFRRVNCQELNKKQWDIQLAALRSAMGF